ncbi:MAG TPA: hypothetical protein VK195_11650, partial [Burkholderiaceae bacterium]|nr:hypothetical protein [Burkholderiaceae bacterium]
MQSNARSLRLAMSALAAGLVFAAPSVQAAVNSGSTGVDGVLNPVTNKEVELPPDGVLNYTSVSIPKGVTVTFKRNKLNTPVYMLVSGDVLIQGTLDLRGQDGKASGTYGDGVLGDDGEPGRGGPGGFDGGRGGRDDATNRPEIINGGPGQGPGGGPAGVWVASGWCTAL